MTLERLDFLGWGITPGRITRTMISFGARKTDKKCKHLWDFPVATLQELCQFFRKNEETLQHWQITVLDCSPWIQQIYREHPSNVFIRVHYILSIRSFNFVSRVAAIPNNVRSPSCSTFPFVSQVFFPTSSITKLCGPRSSHMHNACDVPPVSFVNGTNY